MTREEWHNLSEETYRKLFKGSAVKRAKYSGLVRNIEAAGYPNNAGANPD
jgi:epoxyqueuosine reductase